MTPKATLFRFRNYNFDAKIGKITFDYRVEFSNRNPLDFTETVILPKVPKNIKQESIRKLLESLLIILGISYYKLYCPSRFAIPFRLSKEQADFWNVIYKKGLGEFLYKNKLNPKRLAKFPYSNVKIYPERIRTQERVLLGIGGGKDSIAAAELLKNFDTTSFLVETQKQDLITDRVVQEIGRPSLKIRRMLDPKIFQKHLGAYNGHVPVSAIFAFLGLLSAAIYEYKYVIVANEHSSNFGNIRYKGEIINHQWSKSVEFESLLQEYVRKFITPDIVYFSLLRQFYEIRIVRMFAELKRYFPLFTSCNRNFRVFKGRPNFLWCGECPKCASMFLMLSPFLGKKSLSEYLRKIYLRTKRLSRFLRACLGSEKLSRLTASGRLKSRKRLFFLPQKNIKMKL